MLLVVLIVNKEQIWNLIKEEAIKAVISGIGLLVVGYTLFYIVELKVVKLQSDLQNKENFKKLQYDLANELILDASRMFRHSIEKNHCAEEATQMLKKKIQYATIMQRLESCFSSYDEYMQGSKKSIVLGSRASVMLDKNTTDIYMELWTNAYRTEELNKSKKVDLVFLELQDKIEKGALSMHDVIRGEQAMAAKISVWQLSKEDTTEIMARLVASIKENGYWGHQ